MDEGHRQLNVQRILNEIRDLTEDGSETVIVYKDGAVIFTWATWMTRSDVRAGLERIPDTLLSGAGVSCHDRPP